MEYQDLEKIRRTYQGFKDEKIVKIAQEESKGLRNEVIPILINEIDTRQLDSSLKDYIVANRRILTVAEKGELSRIVKRSLCSLCGNNRDLTGYRIVSISGILIDTIRTERNLIICKSCGLERHRKSFRQTMILGWWSILGTIQTGGELLKMAIRLITREALDNEEDIDDFIDQNLTLITLSNDDPQVIKNLLDNYNRTALSK